MKKRNKDMTKRLKKKWMLATILLIVLIIAAAASLLLNKKEVQKSADVVQGGSGSISLITNLASDTVETGSTFNVTLRIETGSEIGFLASQATIQSSNLSIDQFALSAFASENIDIWAPPPELPNSAACNGSCRPKATRLSFCFGLGGNNPLPPTVDLYSFRVTAPQSPGSGNITIVNENARLVQVQGGAEQNILGSLVSRTFNFVAPEENRCENGIKDGDETGVDCGGSCPACDTTPIPSSDPTSTPSSDPTSTPTSNTGTCSDGKKNGNEAGVDCGGRCAACKTSTSTSRPRTTTGTPRPSSGTTTKPVDILATLKQATSESEFRATWDSVNISNSFLIDIESPATRSERTTESALAGVSFLGKAYEGTTVHLFVFSAPLHKEVVADANNNWTATFDEPISSGSHNAYAVLVAKDGAITRSSSVQGFSIDAASGQATTGSSTNVDVPEVMEESTTTPTEESNSKLYIIIGAVVGIVLLVVIIAYIIKKKREGSDYTDFTGGSGTGILPPVDQTSANPPETDSGIGQSPIENYVSNPESEMPPVPSSPETTPSPEGTVQNPPVATDSQSDSFLTSDPLANNQGSAEIPVQPVANPPAPQGNPQNIAPNKPDTYNFGHQYDSASNKPDGGETNSQNKV